MKTNIFIIIISITFIIKLSPYESGWEFCDMEDEIDCLDIIENEILMHRHNWLENHCKITSMKIIELFKQKELLRKLNSSSSDLRDFATSQMGRELFSDSKKDEHLLFFINLCGSAHVLIIEKRNNQTGCWWRIFQSWQNQMSLAEWLGIDKLQSNNEIIKKDFITFGDGSRIKHSDQLIMFLSCLIKNFQPRMQQFKEFGLVVPFELEIIEYQIL